MSANLQREGLHTGFELGLKLDENRAVEVFDRLHFWMESAPWKLYLQPKLGDIVGQVRFWIRGRLTDDFKVLPSTNKALGEAIAQSAGELDAPRPPLPEGGDLPQLLAHQVRCLWTVVAPVLASNAKEILKPAIGDADPGRYAPPVFREPSGRVVVVVSDPRQLDSARETSEEVNASAIVVASSKSR